MSRPPQKLPMGKPPEARQRPRQSGPTPPTPAGPGSPSTPRGPQRKSGGSSIAVVLLLVFGGIGLLLLVSCGGLIWFVSVKVQQGKAALKAEMERIEKQQKQQANNRQQPGRPGRRPAPQHPSPSPPRRSPTVNSVSSALAALDELNPSRRREAVEYLTEKPIDASQRDRVVAKAISLLGDFHRGKDAQKVLKRWAGDDQAATLAAAADAAAARNDRNAQRVIVEMLAATGSSSAPHLLPYMNDRDANLRETVRGKLAEWSVEESVLAAQSLNDLQSGDDYRADEAAKWFAAHVIVDKELSPKVSDALVSLLGKRNVRADAQAALKFWATADTVPALIDAAAAAHAAPDHDAERACVQLLTGLNDARALPTYAAYLATRHDPATAKAAFTAIGESGAKTVLPLIHHQDASVRQTARELLGRWKVESSVWVTQSMSDLQSGDVDRQREALRYLNSIEPDETVKSAVALALIGLVDNQRLRGDALRALKKWATSETVPKLIELLDHKDRSVQGQARAILVATKDPRAVEPIAADFGDDFIKRVEARRNLIAMGPVAETALWPHVTNKDWRIAKDACDILAEIGTKKSIPVLQAAMTTDTPFVKGAAENAIKRIEEADRQPGPMPGVAAGEDDGTRKMRTWTDAAGQNKIEALFIEFKLGKVRLRTAQGRFLSLKLDQLSPADRKYVLRQVQ